MERSEPSLVPEWLRSKVGGGSSHHSSSLQADRKSSSNSSRSSSSNNSSSRRDRNHNLRPYNNSSRNQCSKDREYLRDDDTWAFEYSDPLTSFTGRRQGKGSLERSKSMISGRGIEPLQRRGVSDPRNRNPNIINNNRNEPFSVSSGSTSSQMSFEKDYPFSGTVERSTTPDIIRVPSPGLNRGVQGLSIRSPPKFIGSEGRTSALAKVPVAGVGSNTVGSTEGLQRSSDAANGISSFASASTASTAVSNGFSKTEAVVQAPGRSSGVQQGQRFEELSFVGNKKLIPMTPSVPQKMVLNPSDKLKPKTAARTNDLMTGPKNGLHQIAPPQLGSQTISSLTSASKNGNLKHPPERKTSANNSNAIPVADKRLSLAQIRSRHNFLNMMREKSLARSSSDAGHSTVVSSDNQSIDGSKGTVCGSVGPSENGDGKCNGDVSNSAKGGCEEEETAMSHIKVIHSDEELEFLRALGWEDDSGDDEGLTEEEINAFVNKYMTSTQAAKLLRGLQLKTTSDTNSQGPCTASASSEPV